MNIRTLNDVFFTVASRNDDRVMLNAWKWRLEPHHGGPIASLGHCNRAASCSPGGLARATGWRSSARTVRNGRLLTLRRCCWVASWSRFTPRRRPSRAFTCFQHSEARIAFVSTRKQYEKVESIRAQTKIERIVVMDKVEDLPDVPQMQYILSGATDRSGHCN